MEHVKNIPKIANLGIPPDADMAINCEWVCHTSFDYSGWISRNNLLVFKGAFDSFEHEHLPRTKYDAIVDETSNKPGEQAFEVSNSSLPHIENCLFTVVGYFRNPPLSTYQETHLGSISG